MKNAVALKASKTESPKTPGGISKSLLTPCRRVGLSRNFRKSGASPFQSPISSKTEGKEETVLSRKRKDSSQETPQTPENVDIGTSELNHTPARNVELPRRKRSKTLLASITTSCDENNPSQEKNEVHGKNEGVKNDHFQNSEVTTPVHLKSKSRSKKNIIVSKSIPKETAVVENKNLNFEDVDTKAIENKTFEDAKKKSPNNLTKECIVVIQKKIFRKELEVKERLSKSPENVVNSSSKLTIPVSQPVFDSDSDDVPLMCLNKDNKEPVGNKVDDEDDFDLTKPTAKPEKTKSKTKLKSPSTSKAKNNKMVVKAEVHKAPIYHSSGDEDDDFFEKKKTILIRKTYDKVVKPQKAKSTGSITQKDIDDLKARIETKKKMLLARAMKEDTKELRDLIKKWQKGCQDALMELMDLMKSKFPDKQNMDYSEILQTLNIPASIVGYDSDNDCFLTPDDESIVLSKFK